MKFRSYISTSLTSANTYKVIFCYMLGWPFWFCNDLQFKVYSYHTTKTTVKNWCECLKLNNVFFIGPAIFFYYINTRARLKTWNVVQIVYQKCFVRCRKENLFPRSCFFSTSLKRFLQYSTKITKRITFIDCKLY